MTSRRSLLWLLLLAATAYTGCERREEAAPQAQPGVPPAPAPGPAPETPGAVAPAGLLADVREDLAGAREDLAENDREDAAEELRDAAGKLRRYAQSAATDVRQDLANAATELDALAGEVRSGGITSTAMLDERLAGVHAALAKAHAASSREAWGRRDLAAAGRQITAAADELEIGLTRLGHGVDAGAASVIRDARDLGGRLARGAEATPSDVERVFKGLGDEIEKLHRAAAPSQR
ncbi:MAG: hypothetical protein DIU52_008685 [bacterium]|jgi:hypothetical protein